MIIQRKIQPQVEDALFKGKIVVIYGPRQVGKTTLAKLILQNRQEIKSAYFNCDEPDICQALTDKTSTELKLFLGDSKLVVLDEAQRVKNIGLTLKLLADNYPKMQIIATGSSSFDLSNQIFEPLTGRKKEFYLYPFSLAELKNYYSEIEFNRILENRMVFGMYPGVIFESDKGKSESLRELAKSYVYKDALEYQGIKNSEVVEKLLQALALQVGNEVSYNEISSLIEVNKITVANYIQILEKAFIVFRLPSFSRNLRDEIKSNRKIYFFDNGIRNALINNLNPVDLRQDAGALWENFMISERVKHNGNISRAANMYFWRTLQQQEIDLIEDRGGELAGYEFKWKSRPGKVPVAFSRAYPDAKVEMITKENYKTFAGL
ncbi:MAG TPA: ATP-binding protein [Candidatus Pacearchaeota archaeon]|nr:ATP-binding protein [Candidatus Pacearchaeota archaeon]